MKKFLIVVVVAAAFLSFASAKSKKNDSSSSKAVSSENLSVAEQLEKFIEAHSSEPEIRFVYSGEIKEPEWYSIRDVLKKTRVKVALDFSKAECKEKEENRFLPNHCFEDIDNLTEIRLPEGLTSIWNGNFYRCRSLRAVYFPENTTITKIDGDVLSSLESLEEVHLYNFSGKLNRNVLRNISRNFKPVLKILEMPEDPVFLEKNRDEFSESDFGLVKTVRMGNKTVAFDEWVKMCKDIEPKNVPFSSATASSCAAEKYSGEKLIDGSWTSWVEGKSDEGTGESIELTLSEPTSISSLEIKNGFGNIDYYLSNNRVKDVEIVLDDLPETSRTFTLEDTPYFQTVVLNDFKKPYSKIRFTVKSVYKGSGPDNDTCISEIRVNYYYTDFEMDPGWNKLTAGLTNLTEEKGYYWEIFPGENGKHLMSVSHYDRRQNSVSDFAGFFVWENGVWKNVYGESLGFAKTSAPESIQPVINMIQTFKAAKVPFKVETDYNRTELRVIPCVAGNEDADSYGKLSLHIDFKLSQKGFTGFEKTPFTAICFDEPSSLTAFGDWEKSLTEENGKLNYLLYAAIFNQNPSMIHYLAEKGYSPNEYEGSGTNMLTPYEAGIKYNNQAAKKALEECGGTYRKELLLKAFEKGDFEQFKELSQYYSDISFVLAYSSAVFNNWHFNSNGAQMQKFLNFMRDRNVDIFKPVTDLEGRKTSLLAQALAYTAYKPVLFKLVCLYDWKITGNEVADFVEAARYNERNEVMDIIKKLNEKSPFKDLSSEQKNNITRKIVLYCTKEEIQYFMDQKAVDFSPFIVKGYGTGYENDRTESVLYNLMYSIRKDNDYDEIARMFVEAGADINFKSVYGDGGKSRSVMGALLEEICFNSVGCEKHYKLFEYLYNKGARPSVSEIEHFVVGSGLGGTGSYYEEYKEFDLRYKYVYRYILKDFTGPVFKDKKTLAQLLTGNLNYMDNLYENHPEHIAKLEECFKTIISDLNAENAAGDWKKNLFKKAGFSNESIARIGL